jgi:hypothetical protein
MPKKKNPVLTQELVFDLARQGMGYARIGEEVGLKYQGCYKAINADEDLKLAYQDGHRLHDEELIETIRAIATDPKEKANNRIQAFDKLMRHTEGGRKGELQEAALVHLSDEELMALAQAVQMKELEKRLGKGTRAHDGSAPQSDAEEPTEKVIDLHRVMDAP